MLKVANLNCNGVRAALRKGLEGWMRQRRPDILCLQEIRATPEVLGAWANGPRNWHAYWRPAAKPGYAGVALLSRRRADTVVTEFGDRLFDHEGRWIEAHFGDLIVASVYLPSGSSGPARQQIKFQCMKLLYRRLAKMLRTGKAVIVAGDINIAHTKQDITNWKSNLHNSGFLPDERAWLDRVTGQLGWTDMFRQFVQGAGHHTWWAQRGDCRARNIGWRIDYQFATAPAATCAVRATIDTKPVLSDHAPLVVDYAL